MLPGAESGLRDALAPRTRPELSEMLRDAGVRRERIAVLGEGSRDLVSTAGRRILFTGDLEGGVEIDPEEMVLTAAAGTPLARIDEETRRVALSLPPLLPTSAREDPGTPRLGTLGGLYSDPREPPWFPALGRTRDHVLGIEGVRGDGVPFKAGGRVVKNVTGYDLTRFLAGARGRFAVITRLHWRLQPCPETVLAAQIEHRSGADLWTGVHALRQCRLDLLLFSVVPGWPYIHIACAGRQGVAEAQLARLVQAAGGRVVWSGAFAALEPREAARLTAAPTRDERGDRLWLRVRAPFRRWHELLSSTPPSLGGLLEWRAVHPAAHFGLLSLDRHAAERSGALAALVRWVAAASGSIQLEAVPHDRPLGAQLARMLAVPAPRFARELARRWDRFDVLSSAGDPAPEN